MQAKVVRRAKHECYGGVQRLGRNRPSSFRWYLGGALVAWADDGWRVHGESGVVGARSRTATAVRNPDRCNAISVSTRARGHGMAEQLHNPSLWFGWRSEIRLTCPRRVSEHYRSRRERKKWRSRNLSGGVGCLG